MKKQKDIAKRTALDGILCAVALVLSFFETMLPDIAFLPPGAKLGLSNIAIMFAVMAIGIPDGLFIVVCKSLFVLLTRGPVSFFMSISGGILSFLCLSIVVYFSKKKNITFSFIGISVFSAIMHNIGQLIAAGIYTRSIYIFTYLPLLLIFAIFTGGINGIVVKTVLPKLFIKGMGLKE